jgi:hypothetical protein
VLGRIGHRESGHGRQLIDAARPLGDELQQLQPVGVADGLGHARQLQIDVLFEVSR